jgi:hypothetical protein
MSRPRRHWALTGLRWGSYVRVVQDEDEEQAVTPEDPLNSYSQPSWRGLIITVVAVVVVTALLIGGLFAFMPR